MVVDEVRSFFPHRIFDAYIPRSVRLAEAPSYGQSIIEYDRSSRGADAYTAVTAELLQRLGLSETSSQPESKLFERAPEEALAVVNPGTGSNQTPQEGEIL
jgi:hypothetical protein